MLHTLAMIQRVSPTHTAGRGSGRRPRTASKPLSPATYERIRASGIALSRIARAAGVPYERIIRVQALTPEQHERVSRAIAVLLKDDKS